MVDVAWPDGDGGSGDPSGGGDLSDLAAQIRGLTAADPAGVRQVVAEVLAALDRVSGGTLHRRWPDDVCSGTDLVATVEPGEPVDPSR